MNQGYTKTVDWWTLGVLLYEMMVRSPCIFRLGSLFHMHVLMVLLLVT